MGLFKNINFSLIAQSIPSLLISLIGLAMSGKKLEIEQHNKLAELYPILLLSNCILSFKGNIELIYGMHLSSLTQIKNHRVKEFLKYAFDNGCLVLAQSTIIGFSVGILGLARNIMVKISFVSMTIKVISICLISSFLSSLIIICMLIPSVLFAFEVGINPDNIILPIIASIGDYFDISILIFCIKKLHYASTTICFTSIVSVLMLLPFLIYISVMSAKRIPLQSVYILVVTYCLSTISGYLIQFFSIKHVVLAASYPLFCGLTSASAYIYLNRKITTLQNQVPYNKKRNFTSVIITSIIIAILITILMPVFGIYFLKSFSICLMIGFVFTVALLLKLIDVMMRYLLEDSDTAGVIGLPLLTSLTDFVSAIVVITISCCIYGI